jgi:hypothetical protein
MACRPVRQASGVAFGVKVPVVFMAPYIPFEYLTGVFVVFRSRKALG